MGPQTSLIAAIAEQVVRDVSELPDRSSPEDWPEACLVTGDELHAIVVRTIEELSAVPPESLSALADIVAERRRQIEAEGWSLEHDDAYDRDDLAAAAACYAVPDRVKWVDTEEERRGVPSGYYHILRWPWAPEFWKPKDPRRNLVRAGALILAEIERRDRLAARPTEPEVPTPVQPVPCPCCRRIPVVIRTATQFLIGHDPNDGAAVSCPFNPVVLPSWAEHEADAISAWNRVMAQVPAAPTAGAGEGLS